MREGFCVDASVGLKWFLGDEDLAAEAAKLAESFLTGHCELIVPALFFYEVGNALSVAVRAG